jgi:hypothetical protein
MRPRSHAEPAGLSNADDNRIYKTLVMGGVSFLNFRGLNLAASRIVDAPNLIRWIYQRVRRSRRRNFAVSISLID